MSEPVYVIFGATGGIGSALSRQLAGQGANLALSARREAPLRQLAEELRAVPVVTDVTQPAAVEACFDQVIAKLGRVDGVAHCVGSLILKPAHQTTDEEWQQTLALNLSSSFYILRRAAKEMMKTGGGALVFCTSSVASVGLPNHEAIAAAKAGLVGLVRSAAATYAYRGVRVNAVAPGLTETPLTARLTSVPATRKASEAMHPLGRLGQASEVAAALAFLLDPRNAWITGQVLGVDGGLAALRPRAAG